MPDMQRQQQERHRQQQQWTRQQVQQAQQAERDRSRRQRERLQEQERFQRQIRDRQEQKARQQRQPSPGDRRPGLANGGHIPVPLVEDEGPEFHSDAEAVNRGRTRAGWRGRWVLPILVAVLLVLGAITEVVLALNGSGPSPILDPGALIRSPLAAVNAFGIARSNPSGQSPTAPSPAASANGDRGSVHIFVIGNTGGEGAYLRRTPSLGDRLQAYPDGTTLQQIGDDTNANGLQWHHVRTPDGAEGWMPAQYTLAKS